MSVRVIPRLDIKGPNLVKGIHLEGLRVLGQPERFARAYYEQGADELVYMDVVASLYGRNSLLDMVSRTAREVFIPICVGGGLRSVEDIRAVLLAGADKISLNTAAVARPELIQDAARRFGSSTVVVSIEAIRRPDGHWEAYTDNGRNKTGRDALEWAMQATALGAGELMVTSIDREGTGKGYDLELVRAIADRVSIPVIACGGVGAPQHAVDAVVEGHADAVSMASVLHYQLLSVLAREHASPTEGNVEFLRSGRSFSTIKGASLIDVKSTLLRAGIDCRPPEVEAASVA